MRDNVASAPRALGRPHRVSPATGAIELERLTLGSGKAVSEADLQALLFQHPQLLPIVELEPGFGLPVPVARELACGHGFVDLVYLTGGGDLLIAETKLWSNPQARREVAAQALDYAAALGNMGYEAFERAVLAAGRHKGSLYDLVCGAPDCLDEASFIDAVARNLAAGRLLVIVAGDGIRREMESLADLLQRHAGSRFSFAMVELALYPLGEDLLVLPSTLMRTTLVERGVVRVEQGQVRIDPVGSVASPDAGPGATLSEESFLAALAGHNPDLQRALRHFLGRLAPLGVYPDYRASLNLKVDRAQDGQPVNLGYIQKNGGVRTDAVGWFAPLDAATRYVTTLADLVGGVVKAGNGWSSLSARRADGLLPHISDLLPTHEDAWFEAVRRLIQDLGAEAALPDATAPAELSGV